MSQVLMCKNVEVYNLYTEEVKSEQLLPGLMKKCPCDDSFKKWMKERYSCGTNTYSRKLKALMSGVQGQRDRIDMDTHALSYTDCYWIKEEDDTVTFEQVSPYYSEFWNGDKDYKAGMSVPSLYVPGALSKYWTNGNRLIKEGNLEIEIACIELCKACGVPVENGSVVEGGIALYNFTSPHVMLEQANMSGRIHAENFEDEDIVKEFGIAGLQMLTIDAIVGNGDRHAGNFGWLRNSDTGEYLGMAPLYDFDHALDSSSTESVDIMLRGLRRFIRNDTYAKEMARIARIAMKNDHAVFSKRAKILWAMIEVSKVKRIVTQE